MGNSFGYIYPYVYGSYAEESYKEDREVRGFFETEDAWVGFDNTDGIRARSDFLMKWQAMAFAATDIDVDEIWAMTEKDFMTRYRESIDKLYRQL